MATNLTVATAFAFNKEVVKMAAAAAALLDELMGRNRNAAPNEKAVELNWEDPEVKIIIFIWNHFPWR